MPLNRMAGVSNDERLTGYVKGKEASDLEERFARALHNKRKDFDFQQEFLTAHSIPGQEKEVDFVVHNGQPQPIEIDGTYAHKSGEQRANDQVRDAILNEHLGQRGYLPIIRIPGTELETQADTLAIVEKIL
jgi:very-short-patch-repair endonuclease